MVRLVDVAATITSAGPHAGLKIIQVIGVTHIAMVLIN